MAQQDFSLWLNEVYGCLQDMGADTCDRGHAKQLFTEGYSAADAAAELMNDEEE